MSTRNQTSRDSRDLLISREVHVIHVTGRIRSERRFWRIMLDFLPKPGKRIHQGHDSDRIQRFPRQSGT